MSERTVLEVVGRTHPGRVRDHNEDTIGEDLDNGIVVLADGMGGYKGGEVASAIAVDTILRELKAGLAGGSPLERDTATGYCRGSLIARNAVIKANETIFQTAKRDPKYHGMGTTVALAVFYGNRISVAHVGDSRIYRYRDEELSQITVDHTLLQELIDRGFYTEQEAKTSMNKNLVTRALGVEPTVAVDIQESLALPGDIYILCSDGLNDMLEDAEIRLTIKRLSDNLGRAADELIRLANEKGGKDNVSVILARPLGPEAHRPGWIKKIKGWFSQ